MCEWDKFEDFKRDMYDSFTEHEKQYGGRNTSIDRKNVNGNYCKDNCVWATMKEQSINRVATIVYKGVSLSEYCKTHGINYNTIMSRKNYLGWTIEEAIDGSRKFRALKRPVLQYDLEGKFIREYESVSEAHRDTGISLGNLSSALKGTYKQTGGFIWKHKNIT